MCNMIHGGSGAGLQRHQARADAHNPRVLVLACSVIKLRTEAQPTGSSAGLQRHQAQDRRTQPTGKEG